LELTFLQDHLPKSCKGISLPCIFVFFFILKGVNLEVEDDKHLNSQHAIEEAMSTTPRYVSLSTILKLVLSSSSHEEVPKVSKTVRQRRRRKPIFPLIVWDTDS